MRFILSSEPVIYRKRPLLDQAARHGKYKLRQPKESAVEAPKRESLLNHRPLIEANQEYQFGSVLLSY
jgi:hypothetical protein